MSTATTNDPDALARVLASALLAAVLPFAVVLAGIRYAAEDGFWWIVVGLSVFMVAFPAAVCAVTSRLRGAAPEPRFGRRSPPS